MSGSPDMKRKLVVYRGFPSSNQYTWSPFVTKLEFRLRHAGISYETQEGSPRNGPSGKIPYVDISTLSTSSESDQENLIGDSTIIINTLINRELMADLNSNLSPADRVADLSIRALCEDKLYFLGMSERWLENYYIQRDHIFASQPWILKVVIGNLVHRKTVNLVNLQGCGRFSDEEQTAFREEVWRELDGILNERRKATNDEQEPFWLLGGKQPTEADAVVFGFVNSTLVCKSCPRSTKFVSSCRNLMDYASRIHNHYFQDYKRW